MSTHHMTLRVSRPPVRAPKSHWKAILTMQVDRKLWGSGFRRKGPISWKEPPLERYLNGTVGSPGYIDVSFSAVGVDR